MAQRVILFLGKDNGPELFIIERGRYNDVYIVTNYNSCDPQV